MIKYTIPFTEIEKNIFNTKIECQMLRDSHMSVFSFVKKQILGAGNTYLKLTVRGLHKKYIHHHQKISKSTMANRLNLLVSIGLLEVVKNGQEHLYKLAELKENDVKKDNSVYALDSSLDSILDSSNKAQAIDMTEVEEVSDFPKYKNKNNNIYNIYITASEADAICDEVIKELGIKRKIVKNAIKLRIKQFVNKINPAGAYQYITKVAIDTYNFFRISSERANKIATILMNKKKSKEQAKKGSFCNYQQREYTKEQYAEIEEACSGWGETYAEQQQRLKLERDEALANVTEDEFGGRAEIEAYYATLIHDEPLEVEDLGIGSGLNDDNDDDLIGWF